MQKGTNNREQLFVPFPNQVFIVNKQSVLPKSPSNPGFNSQLTSILKSFKKDRTMAYVPDRQTSSSETGARSTSSSSAANSRYNSPNFLRALSAASLSLSRYVNNDISNSAAASSYVRDRVFSTAYLPFPGDSTYAISFHHQYRRISLISYLSILLVSSMFTSKFQEKFALDYPDTASITS
jgi:hypothetical protein